MEGQYRIGDISKKLGISRDTLRFYEKKGVISPKKEENGYRYYSYKDVRILMDILFFRKYDFSLEEIYELLNISTYESFVEKIDRKLDEERELLEQKRRSLQNLSVNKEIISRSEHYLGVYEVQQFPDFRMLKEDLLTTSPKVMELCYIYDEYSFSGDQVKMTEQYMLVPGHAADGLDVDLSCSLPKDTQSRYCVYTVMESDFYSPSPEQLREAADWAEGQGLCLEGKAYAGYLVRCVKDGKQVYYIEVYLPISKK